MKLEAKDACEFYGYAKVYNAADVDALLARIREAAEAYELAVDMTATSAGWTTRAALDALLSGSETVHQCPPDGSSIMPCCGRTPFEVSADRMATDPALVTCRGRAG